MRKNGNSRRLAFLRPLVVIIKLLKLPSSSLHAPKSICRTKTSRDFCDIIRANLNYVTTHLKDICRQQIKSGILPISPLFPAHFKVLILLKNTNQKGFLGAICYLGETQSHCTLFLNSNIFSILQETCCLLNTKKLLEWRIRTENSRIFVCYKM